jgi:hypothetical protein
VHTVALHLKETVEMALHLLLVGFVRIATLLDLRCRLALEKNKKTKGEVMSKNYLVVINSMGLEIIPDYDSWNLNEYVDDMPERFFIKGEYDEIMWKKMVEHFPNIEEAQKVLCMDDVNTSMPIEMLEYAEELIHKYLGNLAEDWAHNELTNLSEHVKEVEKYKDNIGAFYGVSGKDFQ